MTAAFSIVTPFLLLSTSLVAQFPGGRGGGPVSEAIRQAGRLDLDGKGSEARAILEKAIASAPTPSAKASAQRAMAMSWAFDGNCRKTGEYEQMVIDYWVTREKDEPHNAFYQQGEMADEAARVCLDYGDPDAASAWYRKGRDSGLKEPDISDDRKALWKFRWEHAQARIAARRGNRSKANEDIAAAKAALDQMTGLRGQQEPFLPYLTGYVAFYFAEYDKALAGLEKANQNDPFIQCLLGQTYEKLGDREKALECYRKAAMANAHNPPAAFARPFARAKLQSP